MSSGNTSDNEVWTVMRLLTWTTDYLKKHGSPSARLDTEVLLAHALHCERVDLYVRFEQEPSAEEKTLFRNLIRERAAGKPVAYLVGKKEFYSLEFLVNESVLIPRPETEFLVMGLMDLVKENPAGISGEYTLCDVGTGSGNIAITSALQLKKSRVTALDISPDALAVAQQNVAKYSDALGDRVTLLQSDLMSVLYGAEPQPQFDFIVSNPPYVGKCEQGAELEENVFRYEPHVALFGGERGFELIEKLLPQVSQFLKPDGHFLMELSPMIHDEVVAMLPNAGLQYLKTIRDLDQNARIIVAQNEPW